MRSEPYSFDHMTARGTTYMYIRQGRGDDCVTVRSMVNIARLTIWSIYCSREGGEGRADPLIVAPFIGAA